MKSATMGGAATIEVVIADHEELFQIVMAEVFAAAGELRVVGHAESFTQLLNTLERAKPQVLILSTSFPSAFPKIKRILERRQTALLLLAEGNDQTDYMQWLLRAHGIVCPSLGG